MPSCDASFGVALCTEGTSLVPLMSDPKKAVKPAAYSQYPRGYQKDNGELEEVEELGVEGHPTTSNCIKKDGKCTMGYSVVTHVSGTEYRYTRWCDFNTKRSLKVDWGRCVGEELYDHAADPGENVNIAAGHSDVVTQLRKLLVAYAH